MCVLAYLLKSIAILSMFYLVYFIFLRKETFFSSSRYFFLSGIVFSILLPLVEFTMPVYLEQSSLLDFNEAMLLPNIEQTSSFETYDWFNLATIIYLTGLIIFILRFFLQIYSLHKLIGKYPLRIHNNFRFVEISEITSPFSFFKYIFYNPELHNKKELTMIFHHEKVHTSQWHTLDILAANFASIIQWINPIAWLYKKAIEENLEFIADHKTIEQVSSKKQYQLMLVKNSFPFGAPALTTSFFQSAIKKRILMLNKEIPKTNKTWKFGLILPLLCLFLWSFNVKEEINYIQSEGIKQTYDHFTILPNSTDQELNQIENYFDKTISPAKVKINQRKRDANNRLIAFEFRTKFEGEDSYHTRFSIAPDTGIPYKGHVLQNKEGKINISEIGPNATKFKISKELLEFINLDLHTPSPIKEEK